ncbi:alpha-ketoglutarate-dependent dioxygenase AlkB family protein [Pseudoalteromonas sp. SSDWG2]|uniref:alpha-ketoglutarate-dependent dioxygenase AlkB family protein n=1 Tax=Pseudoalteromonas sp. SSDWG2 TaxID=3139391 RepID=UPI003BAC7170
MGAYTSNQNRTHLPSQLSSEMFSYQANAITAEKAQRLFCYLRDTVQWQQPSIQVFGKWHPIPRLQAYMGDNDAQYTYSQQRFTPLPWLQPLDDMRKRLSQSLGCPFNAVLINYYRNGLDCMGWHADDEAELGPQPTIASVSLGAIRKFKLRERSTKEVIDLALESGSLLVMKGHSQARFEHSLPKQRKVSQGRINLTFRYIRSSLL